MKKLIAMSVLLSLVLASCGQPAPEAVKKEEPKTAFAVETKTVSQFSKSYTVEKTGRLVGSSTISLTSQGTGRVQSIAVREGTAIKKGQVLAKLSDTTANYDLRLSQANNTLASVRNAAESTRLSLDKAVSDGNLALTKAETDLSSAEADAAKRLEKAERDASESSLASSGSDATTTLAQLESNLQKAELDYDNLKKSNAQTLANFNTSYQLSVSDLKKFLNKISYEGDKLFGITPKYPTDNILARKYLGAGNSALRPDLEIAYYKIEKIAADFDARMPVNVDANSLLAQLDELSTYYKAAKDYFSVVTTYLHSSVSAAEFPQANIDAYIAAYNGYKNEVAGLEAGYVSFRNSASSFLATYINNENSAAAGLDVQRKQIEVQKNSLSTGEFEANLGLERTKIDIEKSLTQLRLAVDNARLNRDNAIKNREITLRKLPVTETDAALAVRQAQEEVDKLSVTSPIDGTVTRVIASVGQDVSPGTLVVEIANKNPEVLFDLESEAVALLRVGSTEEVFYDGKSYSGTVVGISSVAKDSLLYGVRVSLSEVPKYLGGVATIKITLASEYPFVPTSVVRVVSEKTGEIQTLANGTFVKKEVQLGKVTNGMVEIVTPLDSATKIVMTDVSNFDERKYYPEEKK